MAEPAEKLYRAEYAKSGRASCKKCKENIAKDSLRLAIMVQVLASTDAAFPLSLKSRSQALQGFHPRPPRPGSATLPAGNNRLCGRPSVHLFTLSPLLPLRLIHGIGSIPLCYVPPVGQGG